LFGYIVLEYIFFIPDNFIVQQPEKYLMNYL
jgi:hypothetical protein